MDAATPRRPTKLTTNPSIFLRLNATDRAPREMAWAEFHARYGPIIGGFAKRLGAADGDVADVVQEVLFGFFRQSPTFQYDPAKGRFRSYLKTCTYRIIRRRLGGNAQLRGVSLEVLGEDALAVQQEWNDLWEQQTVRRALRALKKSIGSTKKFRAFEAYVVRDQDAQVVADKLDMHLNSVYRAKEQVTRLLQEKVQAMQEED